MTSHFLGSGGRGRGFRSLLLLAAMDRAIFVLTEEVLKGEQSLWRVLESALFSAMMVEGT